MGLCTLRHLCRQPTKIGQYALGTRLLSLILLWGFVATGKKGCLYTNSMGNNFAHINFQNSKFLLPCATKAL